VELKSKGYQDKDICVLTNQNKYATEIASFLIKNGYHIISSESLLLKNSPEVRMIIAFFKLLLNTGNQIQLANFIENLLVIQNNQMSFHKVYTEASSQLENGIDRLMMHLCYPTVKEEEMSGLSVYELTEYTVSNLFGEINNNIFLHFFLDFAYDYQHMGDGSLASFVEYWEKKCDKTYITMPDGVNAIQVMTIHKAKGLKFESVILDFIPRNDKTTRKDYWTDLELDGFSELQATMLPLVKDLEFVDLEHIYAEEEEKTELDLLNMIYVAFTRPVSALFILSQKKEKSQNRFTSYIQNFLTKQALEPDEKEYEFGELKKPEKKKEEKRKQQKIKRKVLKDMLSASWKGRINVAPSEPVFWELISSTPADVYGNLVHKMLSEVFVHTDVKKVVTRYLLSGIIDEHEAMRIQHLIENVVNHKELKAYYKNDVLIKNETEIITLKNGNKTIHRPDRVVIQDDELIIIDYKTGEKNVMHIEQISEYAGYFNKLGYENVKKMLVYLNEAIEVLSV
jgi:ATP-dependent exoDNAse (exonuclease V) beta subunit